MHLCNVHITHSSLTSHFLSPSIIVHLDKVWKRLDRKLDSKDDRKMELNKQIYQNEDRLRNQNQYFGNLSYNS